MNDRWEYKVVKAKYKGVGMTLSMDKYYEAFETQLNRLGLEGWECYAVDNGVFYLKRKK